MHGHYVTEISPKMRVLKTDSRKLQKTLYIRMTLQRIGVMHALAEFLVSSLFRTFPGNPSNISIANVFLVRYNYA